MGNPSRTGPSTPVSRLALRPDEAADAIGVSRSWFFEVVLPELRVVRRGRVRLIPMKELERWVDENATRLFENAA
jgi:hypothetical protein